MKRIRMLLSHVLACSLTLGGAAIAVAEPLDSTFNVALTGTVSNRTATAATTTSRNAIEPVKFSGPMAVTGRVLLDGVNGAPPVLELALDLTGIVGVGTTSGQIYVTSSQAIVHRPLLAVDTVEVTFPYYVAKDPGSARTAVASLTVYYNAETGVSVTGSIATPDF